MGSFTQKTWKNKATAVAGVDPEVVETEMNRIEQGIADAHTELNLGLGGATDGTTPLRYSAFYAAASENHTTAFQNAINALFANTEYNITLDLEGATVSLAEPVLVPTSGTGGKKSIVNGEIEAADGFTGGDHMIRAAGVTTSYYMRLINVTMNGRNLASWIYWDKGNYIIQACHFHNNKAGTAGEPDRLQTGYNRAGLFCSDGGAGSNADAGFWIDNCWFSCDDGPVEPTSRWRWGIVSQTGDNKIGGGTTMSYFRHSLIAEAPGLVIHGFHPFQGRTPVSEMTNHTASVKLTNGRCGAQISGLYLGKSFMEISNESRTTQREIGEVCITNMRAFMESSEAGATHIVARDYSGGIDDTATITDITITNSKFINGGSVQTLPTTLFNPQKFNRDGFKGVHMSGNTFESTGWSGTAETTQDVWPQANPVKLKKTFAAGTSHVFDLNPAGGANYLPFGSYVNSLVSAMGNAAGATFHEGAVGNWTVDVVSPASWAGDITAEFTCNADFSAGFVDG